MVNFIKVNLEKLISIRKSFGNAINGIHLLITRERNAKIHVIVAVIVIIFGLVLKIIALEWIALFLTIGFVLSMEAMNTAIENISVFIQPERDNKIKIIKDIAAGGVLFSAIVALLVGLLIFVPKLITI